MTIHEILKLAVDNGGSDIHLTVGLPPMLRQSGELKPIGGDILNRQDTTGYVKDLLNEEQFEAFEKKGELDLAYSFPGVARFRLNVFKQRSNDAVVMRVIASDVPDSGKLGLPEPILKLANHKRGLVLVTGPTGSGKSTTLAALIDLINRNRNEHILTLEDPIEYLHNHKKSVVNQREIGNDSLTYASALKAALRQDPDVILVGEMRDIETISIAITAAETGHVVLSTLHTIGAAKTVDRIIDVFPPFQQQQVRVQLSTVLQAVVSQQLIPKKEGKGRVAAFEIMIATPAIRNLIREGKTHQIASSIQTGISMGMQSMDGSIANLYREGKISREEAISFAVDPESLMKMIA